MLWISFHPPPITATDSVSRGGGAPRSDVAAFSEMAVRSSVAARTTPGFAVQKGRRLVPWAASGTRRPLTSSSVGMTSTICTVWSITRPAGRAPGRHSTSGTLFISPYTVWPWNIRPCSRNSSPWSPVNATRTLPRRPRVPSPSTSRPISVSISRIDPSYQLRSKAA
jgi:hypothetical protein